LVLSLFEVVASASWKGLYLVFLLIGLFACNEILIHDKKKKKKKKQNKTKGLQAI
jgi:TctA family transporter